MAELPLSDVKSVECRAGSWDAAANGVIEALQRERVQSGQIIAIDAHNNGPNEEAIFSAHYSRELPAIGPLCVQFERHNSNEMEWSAFYEAAHAQARGKDVISITGSCNSSNGAVMYVFYNVNREPPVRADAHVQFVEARAKSWNAAASAVIAKLLEQDVTSGQVLWIDAHNNGPDEDAIFSAHYSRRLPATGGRIEYESQNGKYGWRKFYDNAANHIAFHNLTKADIKGLTGSCNCDGRSVMYVFYSWRPETSGISLPPSPAPIGGDGELPLSVLSFNIWCDGHISLPRTLAAISALRPDVVCLQEASAETVRRAAHRLGLFFSQEAAVLSRFPVSSVPGSVSNQGQCITALHVPIMGGGTFRVLVGNVHLTAYPYPPYIHRKEGAAPAVAAERQLQLPGLLPVLDALRMLSSSVTLSNVSSVEDPIILCGDFNCASHLDYRGQDEIDWPCSLACTDAGLEDTYAIANPGHLGAWRRARHDAPGITWAARPEEETEGVFDRIDCIYASQKCLAGVDHSVTVDGATEGCDPWPSDHRAVFTRLRLKLPK